MRSGARAHSAGMSDLAAERFLSNVNTEGGLGLMFLVERFFEPFLLAQ
jgi:hypothetical protein